MTELEQAVTGQAFRQFQYPTVPLHLGADWLAGEYRRAAEAIEAQALVGVPR